MAAIALISVDTTGNPVTRTETALENKGHTVTKIDEDDIGSTDFSAFDCIVTVATTSSDAIANAIRAEIDGGKPALLGLPFNGQGAGATGQNGIPTRMKLCGTLRTEHWAFTGANEFEVVDAAHDIMVLAGFEAAEVVAVVTGTCSWAEVDTGQSVVGDVLTTADPDFGHTDGKTETFAIEQGTEDLDTPAVAVGARVVCTGTLHADNSAYSSDGETFLDACVQWLLAGGGGAGGGGARRGMSMAFGMGM